MITNSTHYQFELSNCKRYVDISLNIVFARYLINLKIKLIYFLIVYLNNSLSTPIYTDSNLKDVIYSGRVGP